MTHTSPLALGYIRTAALLADAELETATLLVREFARREGYALATVYVEPDSRTLAALGALLDRAVREEIVAVIVPDGQHLAVLGPSTTTSTHVASLTGARVLYAGPMS